MLRLSKMELLGCAGLPARREGRRHGQWLPCLLLLLLPAACSAAAGSCSATTTAALRALVDPAVYDRQVRPGRANLSVAGAQHPPPDKIQVQLRLLSFKGVDTVARTFTLLGYFRVGVSRVHPSSPRPRARCPTLASTLRARVGAVERPPARAQHGRGGVLHGGRGDQGTANVDLGSRCHQAKEPATPRSRPRRRGKAAMAH